MLIISLPFPKETISRQGYLLQPHQTNDAIDVFDKTALLELRRAVRLQSHL
jgi:hypothetical protein